MERSQLFDLMGELKLYGMKAAFDEIMATAVKRQHEPQRIVGDLLNAEIDEKQARSIKYQLTIAKLPLAKDLADFQFEGTPINQTLVHDLAGGGFIAQQRNAVLVGGTGTGKTHLAIAIARSCIRSGVRGRFYNVVDLVNRLEHACVRMSSGTSPYLLGEDLHRINTLEHALCLKPRTHGHASRVAPGTPTGAVRTGLHKKSNRSPPCRNGNWKITIRDRRPPA
jgi:hypothetical protein